MVRATIDQYYCRILPHVAERSTCVRRSVGAIITDKRGIMLGMGYNGVPSGFEHCIDAPCAGANDQPGDTSRCLAVHAEINAILHCTRLDLASVIYTSCVPCFQCAKVLINTPIRRLVYAQPYAESEGLQLLKKAGFELVHMKR